MATLASSLGLNAVRRVAAGVDPAPTDGPTNTALPLITGDLTIDGFWEFSVGEWDTAVEFDAAVIETDGVDENVLFARALVDGATSITVTPTVGFSMVMQVWARNAAAIETYAESAEFGPMEEPAVTLVAGLIFNRLAITLPPGWNTLGPNQNSVLYAAPPGYGMGGTNITSTQWDLPPARSDPRLQGRNGLNLSTGQGHLRIDLPDGPGEYLVYAGFGHSVDVVPRLGIRDGSTSGAYLLDFNADGAISTGGSTGVADIAGNVTNEAGWVAASAFGGEPVTINPTTSALFISRSSVSGAPHLSCIAIVKVNA